MKDKPQVESIEITNEGMKERIKKHKFTFKPGVNVLIGPNGSGKTSLLEILTSKKGKTKMAEMEFVAGNFYAFDFEKDNPRKHNYYRTPLDVVLRFKSHGESNKTILKMMSTDEATDCILFLDEPEQALDMDGIVDLVKSLKESKASQIIIATHHPYLVLNPEFNVVELVDGYYNKILDFVTKLVTKSKNGRVA